MRFAIFTNVVHQQVREDYYGYAPYIREMNLWLKQVDEVEIVSHIVSTESIANSVSAYHHNKLEFSQVPSLEFRTLKNSILSFLKLPLVGATMFAAMARADHLHLRCPGNIGLIACVLQIFFPMKKKSAKYAGNWDPGAKQPLSYKLQKWILSHSFLTRNMSVLVYGNWPGQSKNIKSFFTASFSEATILKVQEKVFEEPYIFMFVGNLVPGKGLKTGLDVIRSLQDEEVVCKIEIYGDGTEREPVEAYVEEAGIKGVIFKGNRRLEELEMAYQSAHFLILPSKSEGWPKAVAEAMFFGCIPVVTPVSCVPWMLGKEDSGKRREERGILLKDGGQRIEAKDRVENVTRILEVLRDKERMSKMSKAAKEWSWQFTTEKFQLAISQILDRDSKNDL